MGFGAGPLIGAAFAAAAIAGAPGLLRPATVTAQAATAAFDITAFEVTLRPDPAAGTVVGEERITFTVNDASQGTIAFDAGALTIEAVMAE